VSKILVNRLKSLMPQIIDVYQNSFVPMRHINDNIIIAHEIMHSMRKMKDKKGLMTIKVDQRNYVGNRIT